MTANPDLVAFIKKYRKHGAPALRRKLVDEGLDEGEVDAAILAATPKPKSPNARRLPGAIMGGVVSALLVFWALKSGPEHTVRKPGEKQVLIQENPNDPHQAYLGHYGYILRLPLGYSAISDFLDPQNTIEVVY